MVTYSSAVVMQFDSLSLWESTLGEGWGEGVARIKNTDIFLGAATPRERIKWVVVAVGPHPNPLQGERE